MRRIRVIYIFERSEVFATAAWPENLLFLNNLKGVSLGELLHFCDNPFYFAPTNQIRWSSGFSEVPMPFCVLPSVQKALSNNYPSVL